jgi:hypothetical protein
MQWRVIITDTESLTGVAPVCEYQSSYDHHGIPGDTPALDDLGVYDCCPQPHIECWSERDARRIAADLTESSAEPCS